MDNRVNLVVVGFLASLLIMNGCEKKVQYDENSTDSAEFFKEIDDVSNLESAEAVPSTQVTTNMVVQEDPAVPLNFPDKPTLKDVQLALKNANLYEGSIDGVSGPKTKRAIESFQTQNGLKADGKVGPRTWEKLKEYYNAGTAESVPEPTDAPPEVPDVPAEPVAADQNVSD